MVLWNDLPHRMPHTVFPTLAAEKHWKTSTECLWEIKKRTNVGYRLVNHPILFMWPTFFLQVWHHTICTHSPIFLHLTQISEQTLTGGVSQSLHQIMLTCDAVTNPRQPCLVFTNGKHLLSMSPTWSASTGRSGSGTVFPSRTPVRFHPGFSSSPFCVAACLCAITGTRGCWLCPGDQRAFPSLFTTWLG